MTASSENELIKPPSLFSSLRAGFDTTASHIYLILFPAAIDLLIWLGPHLQVKTLLQGMFAQIQANLADLPPDVAAQASPLSNPDVAQLWKVFQDFMVGHFNLMVFLRSFPVGIPSFMSGRMPVGTPLGGYPAADITSTWALAAWFLGLGALGLALGNLYYQVVGQAALQGKVDWLAAFTRWPRQAANTIGLAVAWAIFSFAAFIPFFCISLFSLGALGSLGALVYIGLLLFVLYPLAFAGHAIAADDENLFKAMRSSSRLTRMTLPITTLFLITLFLLSRALEALWIAPAEESWLTLVAIGGHAFASTGLLAASFFYYRSAGRWLQAMLHILA